MSGIVIYLYEGADKTGYERLFWQSLREFAAERGITLPPGTAVLREKGKKPRLNPECGICFSISHTAGLWACAFSQEEVGFDAERVRPCGEERIARRVFHPTEIALVKKDPAQFFSVWTAKESYVKFTGQGITEAFADFCAADGAGLARRIAGAEIRAVEYRAEYRMCVCAKKAGEITLRAKP